MKNLIILSAFCLFLLVGCQQSVDDLVVNENYPISIEASIGDAGGSRYLATTFDAAAFTDKDEVGLAYKVGTDNATSFVKWTLNDDSWNPATEMKWKNIGDDHTFYAFYPYGDDGGSSTLGQVKMPVLTGQDGTMASVATRDFLVATKTMKYSNGGEVSFTENNAFDHVSSLVVLTLKNAGDLASATINNITLTGTNLVAESTYSFDNNTVTRISSDDIMSANISTENSAMVGDFRKFYFVVNSSTVDLSAVTLSITYTSAGGEAYEASKTNLSQTEGHTQFQSGYFYNYGITVSTGNVLTISGHTINKWKNGDSFDITIDNSQKQNQNS